MKKVTILSAVSVFIIFLLGISTVSQAQLRKDLNRPSDLMGPIVKENPSEGADLSNLFNMQMSHSYSMNFASYGGQFQNMNAYTNTMHFFFSEDLTGRVDLQLLHSPFGNSFMNNNAGMNMDFRVRNAELNYEINDNSNISIQFQQLPNYGMNPWSSHSYNNPFHSRLGDPNF